MVDPSKPAGPLQDEQAPLPVSGAGRQDFARWAVKKPFPPRVLIALLVAVIALGISFTRMGLHGGVIDTPQAMEKGVDFARQAWPIRLEVARRVERMVQLGEMRGPDPTPASPGDAAGDASSDGRSQGRRDDRIDPGRLPMFAYIENRPVNPHLADSPVEPFYIERFGYLEKCLWLMLDTIEMAIWGTLLAIFLAIPLGFFAARNYAPSTWMYALSRGLCSLVRAIPELIVALVLVIMYGPGPVAGILALGLHTSGFLGKFFADDIENADPGPQEALRSTGGNRVKVLRIAVLPQVLPQYVAYIQYILERNVRTATILGVVSAGGIGFELMARFKNGEYDAVATILIIVFITVFALEHGSQYLRKKLM
jgi:phosphonate transport system permease protein